MNTLLPTVFRGTIHGQKSGGISGLLRDYVSTKIEKSFLQNVVYDLQYILEYQEQLGERKYDCETSRKHLLQTLSGEQTDPKKTLTAEVETLGAMGFVILRNAHSWSETDGRLQTSAYVTKVGAPNCTPAPKDPLQVNAEYSSPQGELQPQERYPCTDALVRLEREADAFREQLPALLSRYHGEYVAIYQGEVLCADADPHQAKKLARRHPKVVAEHQSTGATPPILIRMCLPVAGSLRLEATREPSPLHVVSQGCTDDEDH